MPSSILLGYVCRPTLASDSPVRFHLKRGDSVRMLYTPEKICVVVVRLCLPPSLLDVSFATSSR